MIFRCSKCGKTHEYENIDEATDDGWREIEGQWYCQECYFICEVCGEYITSDGTYMENLELQVCDACRQSHFAKCEICEDWIDLRGSDYYNVYNDQTGSDMYVCDTCVDEDERISWDDESDCYIFTPRTNRGNRIMREHLNEDFGRRCDECVSERYMCPKCLRKQALDLEKEQTTLWIYDTSLRSYHHSCHEHFKSTFLRMQKEKPFLHYGIELEVLFRSNVDIMVIVDEFIRATNGLFVAETDRSVTNLGNGAEFISRPLSYAKWVSPEIKEALEAGIKVLKKYNAYDPQPEGCGLHVHMSLKFFEKNTEKRVKDIKSDMDWIFQVFQEQIERFSGRPYTQYCTSKAYRITEALRRSDLGFNLNPSIILQKGEITHSAGSGATHHDAVIQTHKTIEIRTFRSTINLGEILGTIEFCRAIAHAARNMKLTKANTLGDILDCKDSLYIDEMLKERQVDKTKKFAEKLEVKINGKF